MVRFALFGCGRIGRVHADSIAVHPRAELASRPGTEPALPDPNTSRTAG